MVSFSVKEFVEAERQVTLDHINFPENSKISLQDTVCTIQFTVQKDLEELIVADSFKVEANFNLINEADSTLLLTITNTPTEVLDARLVSPQVRLNYEQ